MTDRPHVGRFAPSPTGPLHFGSLVAALGSCCDARSAGGRWLVRIEDIDGPRTIPGAEGRILATLARYGFVSDRPVVRQSDRGARYEAALARLTADGRLFECACSRREIDGAPVASSGEHVYPGTCRSGVPADRASRAQRSLRMRVGAAIVGFRDRLQGEQKQDLARDVGDFVVRRADGVAAYQLAVVVDDAAQDVTDVVRGADLLSSTPRQILVARALGHGIPRYLHLPVAIDPAGHKLSKQTKARELPHDPMPALLEAWTFLDQEPLRPRTVGEFWAQAIAAWSPSRLPPVAALPAPRSAVRL